MNKRIVKRHKRQVSRAKKQARTSEPDLRTPEQIHAARAASRPRHEWRSAPAVQRPQQLSQAVTVPPDGIGPKDEV